MPQETLMYFVVTFAVVMAFLMVVTEPENWIGRLVSYLKDRNIHHG